MEFSLRARKFLEDKTVCCLATVYSDGRPHVVPVSYIFQAGIFYVTTDYGTRKLKNIQMNNRVALVVDVYAVIRNKAVVEGVASLVERGPDFEKIYKAFHKRFSWVRLDPWREGEAPFIVIRPLGKVSWGF